MPLMFQHNPCLEVKNEKNNFNNNNADVYS